MTTTEIEYSIATIEGIDIFEHEAMYCLLYKQPIPKDHLIIHFNGNTSDNSYDNLGVYPMTEDDKTVRPKNEMIFHQDVYLNQKDFIKKHFPDVYQSLFTSKKKIDNE